MRNVKQATFLGKKFMYDKIKSAFIAENIDIWGKDVLIQIAMEENAEKIQAISKMCRNPSDKARNNLIEEMADCRLTDYYLKSFFSISEAEIEEALEKKIERQIGRNAGKNK